MIACHGGGIALHGHTENTVSLGLVEGETTSSVSLQRHAYDYRDEDDLTLKIVAAFLPPLTQREGKTHCDPRLSCFVDAGRE